MGGSREFLTEFELMILLAILRVGEDAYGVPIAREIEGRKAFRNAWRNLHRPVFDSSERD